MMLAMQIECSPPSLPVPCFEIIVLRKKCMASLSRFLDNMDPRDIYIYIFAIIYNKSQINDCRHVSARLKPQSIDVTSDANTQMCLDAGLPD